MGASEAGRGRCRHLTGLGYDWPFTLALKGNLLFGLPPNISSSGLIKIDATIVVPAINLTWTVFDSGGNWATYDRAKYLALASKMALNEANEKVALQIYSSYFKLLSAKAQLFAAKTADATSRAVEDSVKLRFTNGLASTVEVAQARAQRLASLAQLIKATGDVENARVGLAVEVGMRGGQAIDIPAIDQAPSPEVIEASANDLVQQAPAKRPDLIEAADRIKAAQYQEKEARSKLWPKIGIIASEMYTTVTVSNTPSSVEFLDVHGNTYVLAGNLSWNIFDAGARYRRLQQAKSEVREATDKLDSMRLVAEQEVWTAYTGVTTALAEQDATQASLDAATESFHVTETAYANGAKQLLDLEQSQSELAKADSAYQTARAQTLMLAAQLAFSTGDLLEAGSKLPSVGSSPVQDVK